MTLDLAYTTSQSHHYTFRDRRQQYLTKTLRELTSRRRATPELCSTMLCMIASHRTGSNLTRTLSYSDLFCCIGSNRIESSRTPPSLYKA
jgi:hypothetical protein